MILYSVGTNMTGYLPDNAPYVTTDRDAAADYMRDEINCTADYYAEGLEDDDRIPATLAELDTLLGELAAWQEDGENRDGWGDTFIGHAPARSYWIERLGFETVRDAWRHFTGDDDIWPIPDDVVDWDSLCETLGEMS